MSGTDVTLAVIAWVSAILAAILLGFIAGGVIKAVMAACAA